MGGVGRWVWVIVAIACVVGAPGAWGAQGPRGDEKGAKSRALSVVVTIPPLEGLVRSLLPEGASVRVLMPPGRSEHGFEFSPGDLAAVARADVVVLVGPRLETRLDKEIRERPVASRQVVRFSEMVGEEAVGEGAGHGHDGHEGHEGHDHSHDSIVDQHYWLDPVLVEKLIPAVRGAVERALTARGEFGTETKERLEKAEAEVVAKVRAVHEEHVKRLGPLKGRAIVTAHNAFGRLGARYGIEVAAAIRPIESAEPTPADLAAIVKQIGEKKVRAIFVEPQLSGGAAKRIAEVTKIRLGTLDPLGSGDWFAMMRANLDAIVLGVSDGAPASGEKK